MLGLWCLTPLSTMFKLYRGSQFIDGGIRSTQRKPPTCRKLLIKLFHILLYQVHFAWVGFELSTSNGGWSFNRNQSVIHIYLIFVSFKSILVFKYRLGYLWWSALFTTRYWQIMTNLCVIICLTVCSIAVPTHQACKFYISCW